MLDSRFEKFFNSIKGGIYNYKTFEKVMEAYSVSYN